jgi:hypothetical protein
MGEIEIEIEGRIMRARFVTNDGYEAIVSRYNYAFWPGIMAILFDWSFIMGMWVHADIRPALSLL